MSWKSPSVLEREGQAEVWPEGMRRRRGWSHTQPQHSGERRERQRQLQKREGERERGEERQKMKQQKKKMWKQQE